MEFVTKTKKENGFSILNPTPEILKIILENGWKEVNNNVPASFSIPKEYTLTGSEIFGLWTKNEYNRVKSYIPKEYIKQIKLWKSHNK